MDDPVGAAQHAWRRLKQPAVRGFGGVAGRAAAKVITGRAGAIAQASAGPAIVSRCNECSAGRVIVPTCAIVDGTIRYFRAEDCPIRVFRNRGSPIALHACRRVKPTTGWKAATGATKDIGDIRTTETLKVNFKAIRILTCIIDHVKVS
jgi:hypothetical protein